MYVNATVHRLLIILKALAVLMVCGVLLVFSKSCSQGAQNGIEFCLTVIVPSLFPFMAFSTFLVESGLSNKIGKPFSKITKALFGLNGSLAPIILLSVLGGYPVGAKGISTIYKNNMIDEHQAKKASLFMVCAGPGFIINFVGISIYNNPKIGIIILGSQIISVIILGIFINLFDKSKSDQHQDTTSAEQSLSFSSALVKSAIESSKGILMICAFVVLFSAFIGIIGNVITDTKTANAIYCLLEICLAVKELSKNAPIELVAFAVGFGGICVHFQIFSALGNIKINKLLFFCIRIIQGVVTGILTHFGLIFFNETQQVFSTSSVELPTFFGGTVLSAIALVGVAICFLYTLKNYKQN